MIIGLMAMDQQNGIGVNNTIPWHNKEDMQHFKQTTMNKDVVIGSTTYLGLRHLFKGEILPGRHKFVVSKKDYVLNEIGFSFTAILQIHKSDNTLYVIGGKTIYEQFAAHNLYDELIITFIDGVYNCDVFLTIKVLDSAYTQISYHGILFTLSKEVSISNGVIRYYTKFSPVVDQ